MKKYIYLLMAIPALFFTACSDDDKIPNVEIYANFEGGTQIGDVYYVVQGNDLVVTEVTLVNNGDKEATIGGVRYFWDYMPIGNTITKPYGITIMTGDIPTGNHLLTAEMPIYAVGYSICTGYMAKKVVIVADEADIPDTGATPDNPTESATIQQGTADK